MASRSQCSVTIESRDNRSLPHTSGTLTRLDWTKKERVQNGIKFFLILFGSTIAAVFIPIVHFILVPTLLIASFVMLLDKLKEHTRNDGGTGVCPKCHQNFTIQKSGWANELRDTCNLCREELEIHLVG